MKTLRYFYIILFMGIGTCFPLAAMPAPPDSTIGAPVNPDSLRVKPDQAVFDWRNVVYKSEVRFTALYPPGREADIPDSIIIYIDFQTPGATFWVPVDPDSKRLRKTDYLVLYKNQVQARGYIQWLSENAIKFTARTNGTSKRGEATISFPVLLFLLCMLGGATGGWLRRINSEQKLSDIPFRLFPEKISRYLAPLREMFVGIITGNLLFLLNLVSPFYLEFRAAENLPWLGLTEPLLIGFLGGWGGIHLLVGLLNQFFSRMKTAAPGNGG